MAVSERNKRDLTSKQDSNNFEDNEDNPESHILWDELMKFKGADLTKIGTSDVSAVDNTNVRHINGDKRIRISSKKSKHSNRERRSTFITDHERFGPSKRLYKRNIASCHCTNGLESFDDVDFNNKNGIHDFEDCDIDYGQPQPTHFQTHQRPQYVQYNNNGQQIPYVPRNNYIDNNPKVSNNEMNSHYVYDQLGHKYVENNGNLRILNPFESQPETYETGLQQSARTSEDNLEPTIITEADIPPEHHKIPMNQNSQKLSLSHAIVQQVKPQNYQHKQQYHHQCNLRQQQQLQQHQLNQQYQQQQQLHHPQQQAYQQQPNQQQHQKHKQNQHQQHQQQQHQQQNHYPQQQFEHHHQKKMEPDNLQQRNPVSIDDAEYYKKVKDLLYSNPKNLHWFRNEKNEEGELTPNPLMQVGQVMSLMRDIVKNRKNSVDDIPLTTIEEKGANDFENNDDMYTKSNPNYYKQEHEKVMSDQQIKSNNNNYDHLRAEHQNSPKNYNQNINHYTSNASPINHNKSNIKMHQSNENYVAPQNGVQNYNRKHNQ